MKHTRKLTPEDGRRAVEGWEERLNVGNKSNLLAAIDAAQQGGPRLNAAQMEAWRKMDPFGCDNSLEERSPETVAFFENHNVWEKETRAARRAPIDWEAFHDGGAGAFNQEEDNALAQAFPTTPTREGVRNYGAYALTGVLLVALTVIVLSVNGNQSHSKLINPANPVDASDNLPTGKLLKGIPDAPLSGQICRVIPPSVDPLGLEASMASDALREMKVTNVDPARIKISEIDRAFSAKQDKDGPTSICLDRETFRKYLQTLNWGK